jgi:hypothetical protein
VHYFELVAPRMRVSRTIILALLTIATAILLPMGRVVEVVYYHIGGPYFMGIVELSLFRLDFLSFSFPGISSVFILWIFVAFIQALNLLTSSGGKFSPIISWSVFLSALIAQMYISSLVLDLALPKLFLVSRVCEPNILCSLPVALGLVLISFGHWQKGHGKQLERMVYG